MPSRRTCAAILLALAAVLMATSLPAQALTFDRWGHVAQVSWSTDPAPPTGCADFRGDSESEPCHAVVEATYAHRLVGRELVRVRAEAWVNATYCLRTDCGAPLTFSGVGLEPGLRVDPLYGGPRTLP